MNLPFCGIKVLDFSHLLPGELCGTILSDLGCDVLRIEPLETPLGQTIPPVVNGESLFFWSRHSNQRRIALNLKAAEAREIIYKLVREADVVIENFRPGVMERFGLGVDDLKGLNGRLIYCSISGYGQNTSWRSRPGHDLNFVAESGVLNLNSYENERPVPPSVLISDYTAGIYAALGVASALYERTQTDTGTQVDVSMLESALSTMGMYSTIASYKDGALKNFRYPSDAPNYAVYECADGRHLAVASLEPPFWEEFCRRIELPQYSAERNIELRRDIYQEIASRIKSKTLCEWQQVFVDSDCCVSPVNTVAEALTSQPITERKALRNLEHENVGEIMQVPTPLFRERQPDSKKANVSRGNETADILKELGYSEEQLSELRKAKVILSDD